MLCANCRESKKDLAKYLVAKAVVVHAVAVVAVAVPQAVQSMQKRVATKVALLLNLVAHCHLRKVNPWLMKNKQLLDWV